MKLRKLDADTAIPLTILEFIAGFYCPQFFIIAFINLVFLIVAFLKKVREDTGLSYNEIIKYTPKALNHKYALEKDLLEGKFGKLNKDNTEFITSKKAKSKTIDKESSNSAKRKSKAVDKDFNQFITYLLFFIAIIIVLGTSLYFMTI